MKAETAGPDAEKKKAGQAAPESGGNTGRTMGLYLHIPFCVRKCGYCDFLSRPTDGRHIEEYTERLCAKIREMGKLVCLPAETVYIGGGTPSILSADQISRILKALRASFEILPGAEITLECNPGTVSPEKLEAWRAGGVTRLSVGCQSLSDDLLRRIGRIHTAGDFFRTFSDARAAGFDNISVDLMSALPGQTMETLRDSVEQAVSLGPEHLSVYSLTLEKGTPIYAEWEQDSAEFPDQDTSAEMDRMVRGLLGKAGYEHYEISNFAKPGFRSRHNEGYWRQREYLGIGEGAVSGIRADGGLGTLSEDTGLMSCLNSGTQRIILREQERMGGRIPWIRFPMDASFRPVYAEGEILSLESEMEECMMLGLRTSDGVSLSGFRRKFGVPAEQIYGEVIGRYESMGFLKRSEDGDRIFLTGDGMEVSNAILLEFLLDKTLEDKTFAELPRRREEDV